MGFFLRSWGKKKKKKSELETNIPSGVMMGRYDLTKKKSPEAGSSWTWGENNMLHSFLTVADSASIRPKREQ